MQLTDGGMLDEDRDSAAQLQIETAPDAAGVRVQLVGELDLVTAPEVDRVIDLLGLKDDRRLLIDLDGVTFMDSTGLASILRARRAAEVNGFRLALHGGSGQVQRLFALAGIADRFTFES